MRSNYIHNYNKKIDFFEGQWTALAFMCHEDDFDWWMELRMPPPSFTLHRSNSIIYAWILPGVFHTKKSEVYFTELKARIIHSAFLFGYEIEHYRWLKNLKEVKFNTAYETKLISSNSNIRPLKQLRQFKEHLEIVNKLVLNEKDQKVIKRVTDDALFDYMRFNAYSFVKVNSLNALSIDYLINIGELGNDILNKRKSPGDIRAKAKAIYRWMIKNYENRGVNYIRKYTDKELKMIRSELAKRTHEKVKEKNKNKVLSAAACLKAEGKKVTVRAVMEKAGVSINTARKYLKELRLSGII